MSLATGKAALFFSFRFCLPLLLSLPLHAAELTLEPQVGFHGLFQLGHPFPLRVDLTNSGRPVEGTVEIRLWKGGASRGVGGYPFYYQREVFLSAQSRKSIQFTVDPDSLSRPLTVSFLSPTFKVSKEIDLRRYFTPSPLVLLLTENSLSPPIPLTSSSPGPLVSLSLADLPSDSRAYQGISTVIIYEHSLRDLSKPQGAALETWLSLGGRMLILGSMHYALYQEPSVARFLPVRVAGLKKFSALPSLEKLYGQRAASLRDLMVQDSTLIEGKIVIEEKGTPILVEMGRGSGKVSYLSLDVGRPPLSRWEGLALLFRDLLGPPGDSRPPLEASWDEAVFSQLLSDPSFISTYVPLRIFFLWLLFYLGGLGFLAWLWQQQRLSRRTLVLSALSLVLFSSFGGYLHLGRGGNIPDGVLVSSTLLQSLPDGYVEALSNVALFSTLSRPYNLQVDRGWTDFEPVLPRSRRSEDSSLVAEEEGGSTRFRFRLRAWDYRLFKIRSVSRFPVRAEIENRGDRLFLKLTNLTAKDLTECWLVISEERYFLGTIFPGGSQVREFPLSSGRPSSVDGQSKKRGTVDLREISFKDRIREILFRYSFFLRDRGSARWDSGNALFFAWVNGSPYRVWVDGARILAHDYTLFRAMIPLGEEGTDED